MFAKIIVQSREGITLFESSRSINHAGDIGGCVHELTRDYPDCVVNVTYAGSRIRRVERPIVETLRAYGGRRINVIEGNIPRVDTHA